MLLFHLCLSGLFSHKLAREKTLEKADGLSLWLHMNLEKYVAAAVERKICHISPAQDTKNIERMKAEGGELLRFVGDWIH